MATAHGYRAIVIEASSLQARAVNEYVLGLRPGSDAAVRHWFETGFGLLDAS